MSDPKTEDKGSVPHVINIVAGIFLAAVSIWLLIVTIPNNIGQAAGKNDISPSLFPTLVAWLLLCLSLILVTVHAAKLRRLGGSGSGRKGVWILVEFGVWMATAALVYLGLQMIGFVVAAVILIVLGALACGYRNYWVISVLAVSMPLIASQMAWWIFQVQMP